MGYFIYIQCNDGVYDYEKEETKSDNVFVADNWLRDGKCDEICVLDALSLELIESYTLEDIN